MKRFFLLFACIAALTGMANSKNQPAERHPFPTTVEAWPKHYPMAAVNAPTDRHPYPATVDGWPSPSDRQGNDRKPYLPSKQPYSPAGAIPAGISSPKTPINFPTS